MLLARVEGNLTATRKHPSLEGWRLIICQPINGAGEPEGVPQVAIDAHGAAMHQRFLQEGNKAKLVIIFRGREIVHPETGHAMLKAVVEACNDIAMVEQNASEALAIAHRSYILVDGRNSRSGPAAELAADPEVRRIFLGG